MDNANIFVLCVGQCENTKDDDIRLIFANNMCVYR